MAISPQLPDNSLSTAEKLDLTFEVLSDEGNKVARKFGLVYTLEEDLKTLYDRFGVDLEASNGDKSYELPLPATYVIGTDHVIRHAFVDADYTKRLDPDEIIAALKEIRG